MVTMYERFANPLTQDLHELSQRLKGSYCTADPFPHCCIDNLISEAHPLFFHFLKN